VLTCKQGSGIRRREVEEVVSREMADALFDAAGERLVEKVRYQVGSWELDRFRGSLKGLALLEMELDAEEAALPPPPQGVSILREVTDDNQFTSSHVASMTPSEQRSWVRLVYGEGSA
jgi:CYTH domain-containing protein